jgi:hypothetical protein
LAVLVCFRCPTQRLLPQLHQLVYNLRRRDATRMSEAERAACSLGFLGAASATSSGSGGSAAAQEAVLVLAPSTCGARLLQRLHDQRLNGEPLLQAAMQRLLWHVNQVLFNQLTMWCVGAGDGCWVGRVRGVVECATAAVLPAQPAAAPCHLAAAAVLWRAAGWRTGCWWTTAPSFSYGHATRRLVSRGARPHPHPPRPRQRTPRPLPPPQQQQQGMARSWRRRLVACVAPRS